MVNERLSNCIFSKISSNDYYSEQLIPFQFVLIQSFSSIFVHVFRFELATHTDFMILPRVFV